MKKRLLSLLLALALCLSVALVPALADGPQVVRSPQAVLVDGVKTDFEVYNIDGSNYFKLRDIAYVLNGTGSQFAVGFDAASNTITVQAGEAYEANGSELQNGEDKSASAVASSQALLVNGKAESLKAYNLGGNNFFQLRALGEALGFEVDYDAESNCVLIVSAPLVPAVEVESLQEFNDAVGAGETNICAKDLTVDSWLHIPEEVTLTVSGTLTFEAACGGQNLGTLKVGTLVMKACQDYSGMTVDPESDEQYCAQFDNLGTVVIDKLVMESGADPGIAVTGEYNWRFNTKFFNMGQLTVKDVDIQAAQFFYEESDENGSWENWVGSEFRTGYWPEDDWDGDGTPDSNDGIQTTITGKVSMPCGCSLPVCANVTVAAGGSIACEDGGYINVSGEGVLTIAEGGSVTLAGGSLNIDGTVNVDGTLTSAGGYIGNYGGTINVDGALTASDSYISNNGTINVDGTLDLADGKLIGVNPYVNEYGDIETETTGSSWLWSDGTIHVSGTMKIGTCSGMDNCGELSITGSLLCSPMSTEISGYVSVAEDGKLSVDMCDWDEARGDEYTDDQGVYWFYASTDDAPYIGNEGTITVSGTLEATTIENRAFLNEGDESRAANIAGTILVKQGGLFRITKWIGNWMGRDDLKDSWFGAAITVEQGAVLELKKAENSPASPCFESSGNVYIYGDMTADKYAVLFVYQEISGDDPNAADVSTANGTFQVDGTFSMADTPQLYLEDGVPVGAERTWFFNYGEVTVNGTFTNKGNILENYYKFTIGAAGKLVMEALPIEPAFDADGDGVNEVFSAFLYNDGSFAAAGTVRLVNTDAEIINYPDSVFDVTGTLDNNGTISEGSYEE